MKLTRKTYTRGSEKAIDFAIGFVGWFIVNGVLYACSIAVLSQFASESVPESLPMLFLVALPLLINIIALVLLGFTRYWIALGALAAFALLLIGGLLIALLFYAVCFNDNNMFR
jgi:L-asparagine transporter-like permease